MNKTYYWELIDTSNKKLIERYCHNCGKKVIFEDSMKRRQNANGKNIYEFAIYKCQEGHSWNFKTGEYKALNYIENQEENQNISKASSYEDLDLFELRSEGIKEVHIILIEVEGKWRIDALLGEKIQNLSRSKVCELIKNNKILLDGKSTKQGQILRKQQKISILLE